MALPVMIWAFLCQMKLAKFLSGHSSSLGVLSSQVTLACVKLTAKAKHDSILVNLIASSEEGKET